MLQTPTSHCNCCGLPIDPQVGENCPRCNYPISPPKEELFLESTLRDLRRVATYGGANITVAGLIQRYQTRLNFLRHLKISAAVATNAPTLPAEVPLAVVDTHAPTVPAEQPLAVAAADAPIAPMAPVPKPVPLVPVAPMPVASSPQRIFSWRSFLVDQSVTIVASLGAFLLLIGALAFIVTNTAQSPFLTFLIILGLHVLFGGIGVSTYRFPSLRFVSRLYTSIAVLLVPLVGYAGYNLIQEHVIKLPAPALIAIAAAYAAIVYAALAVSQRFVAYGYLGAAALVVVDLALARLFMLDYWWWPSMLMLLALLALIVVPRPSANPAFPNNWPFVGTWALLREPVRVLMFTIIAACVLGIIVTTFYSFFLDLFGNDLGDLFSEASSGGIRFSILSTLLLLLLWTSLYLWLTKRANRVLILAYLFLASVLAFCYGLHFEEIGYALALTAVAVLYHGLNRFTPRLLQPFGKFGLRLDQLALILVALVPLISSPQLPSQLFERAYIPYELEFSASWKIITELIAVGVGLALTLSVAFRRANLLGTSATRQNAWPWLLLLSGVLLNWDFSIVVLVLGAVPVWWFLGLTVLMVAGAVIVRRRFGAAWANPVDLLALGEAILTLSLSLSQNPDSIWPLPLFFAALSYGVLLYQRRQNWLFLPLIFALWDLLLLIVFSRLQMILLLGIVLPFAAVVVRRFMPVMSVALRTGGSAGRRVTVAWEWPLLTIALLSGIVVSLFDLNSPTSTVYNWSHVPFSLALELAVFSLVWYGSAALARIKWWLFVVVGFAVAGLLLPDDPFAVLAVLAFVTAVLALGISRYTGRDWAWPLYSIALFSALMMGIRGYEHDQFLATSWVLLGFAVLIYGIGVIEDLALFLWIAPVFATWSVIDSALRGDLYRPPTVALLCAALGVGIGLLNFSLPSVFRSRYNSLLRYALPFYATATAAAVLTGVYGTLGGVNYPFPGAIPDAMLVYALVAYGVLIFERQPRWLGLVAGFAIWGTVLALQTGGYYVLGIGLGAGVVGLLVGRVVKRPSIPVGAATFRQLLARFTWGWPWYLTTLVAAAVMGVWPLLSVEQPVVSFLLYGLLAITALSVVIMLVERAPELLVFPIGLGSLIGLVALVTDELWAPWLLALTLSLLGILIFASQFIWKIIPPATNWLPATRLHRLFALLGQALVVLFVIQQDGLSADSPALAHVGPLVLSLAHIGAGTLLVLALLLFWYGRLQHVPPLRRWSYYVAGLLLSLVVSWTLLAFGVTYQEWLLLAPTVYLTAIAPILKRDESIPYRQRIGQMSTIVGAAFLLLPTLWLSFGAANLLPTLILAGKALALLLLGLGTRLRTFILSGAGLVVVAALHALFLPQFFIPPSLALAALGGILIALATGLSLARRQLQVAWASWE